MPSALGPSSRARCGSGETGGGGEKENRETIAYQHYVDPRGALEKGGLSHMQGTSVVQGGVQIAQRKAVCQKNVIALPNAQETSYRNWKTLMVLWDKMH